MFNCCLICNYLMFFGIFSGKQQYQGNIFIFNIARMPCFGQDSFYKIVLTEKENRWFSF